MATTTTTTTTIADSITLNDFKDLLSKYPALINQFLFKRYIAGHTH